MELYDGDDNGEDYDIGEDLAFVAEGLLESIDFIQETIQGLQENFQMLTELSRKAGNEAQLQIVFDFLAFANDRLTEAQNSMINAEEDLTKINFLDNCPNFLRDYRWEPTEKILQACKIHGKKSNKKAPK